MVKFRDTPLTTALREGQVQGIAPAQALDLQGANLRSTDLRHVDLRRADLRGSYCHSADLRGVDLSEAQVEGASFHLARIAGAYFPANVSAEEIRLSVEVGTRVRCTGCVSPASQARP